MKKIIVCVFLILGFLPFPVRADGPFAVVYLVRYESFQWNPCSSSTNNEITCLSINKCGIAGCPTPAETTICKDLECAKDVLKRRGKDHLTGIYRLTFNYHGEPQSDIVKMSIVESFEIIDSPDQK